MWPFALRLLVAFLTFAVGVVVSSLMDFKRPANTNESRVPAAVFVAAPSMDAVPQLPRTACRATISGGILNGKAISKPAPPYPAIAKAARAQGTVTVQITVDEDGDVTAATAVSGHPLLQQAAVQAARQAKFSPTFLSGQPVKISGVITYNFALE
jgi:TonB family protein